jgi:hypothetical protein
VLDFNNHHFSEFTKEITGTDLLEKYGFSKGTSLEAFLRHSPRISSIPLLRAFMNEWEQTRRSNADHEIMILVEAYYQQLQELESSLTDGGVGSRLKSAGFTSKYLDEQRKLLWE